jgi:O-antigen/teichoic acid export membrane protein
MVNGKTVIKNMSWKFAERITAQVVTFVVSIVLARILDPSDYGVVSLVTVFITIANVFVSDGLGSALIQKKEADALDFSSALYFNTLFSIFLYGILFIAAPFIARFFGEGYEILSPILRVLGLRIIVAAINSVQQAYVSLKMIFQKFFWATLFGTVASAFVGIWMAYHGFGAWALVGQYLTNTTVDTIVLGIVLGKKPILAFSFERVKLLFDYGIKILGSGLLVAVYTEVRSFIIGKVYTASDLAYYDKARQFPSLFVNNIVATISAVLFPKMSSEQDDLEQVKATTKRSIRFTSYLMCPLMFGLAAVAESLVRLLLTDKWLPCVPLLQVLCITYLWQPIHSANIQAIKAVGRSDIILKVEIIKKSIEIVVLVAVMFISVDAIVISMSVNATLFVAVNAMPVKKLLGYSLKEQIKDMIPSFAMSAVMAVVVWALNFLPLSSFLILLAQVIVGVALYIGMSHITKNSEYKYLTSFVKRLRNKGA